MDIFNLVFWVCLISIFFPSKSSSFHEYKLHNPIGKQEDPFKKEDNEYSIFTAQTNSNYANSKFSLKKLKEREQLYEAYNMLHTLAQVNSHIILLFTKPLFIQNERKSLFKYLLGFS